ncbi:hypothetical protein [Sphingomonas sp.]|uniref:hypothetical protein n=1 Tax=Sphingomonas sp. TaxID=28214 RepID=UPI0025F162C2|nr:hypothetical protein [Sphingomonas sp.]MBV9527886.1 hypothetical protein [Sphingomonas sp.]
MSRAIFLLDQLYQCLGDQQRPGRALVYDAAARSVRLGEMRDGVAGAWAPGFDHGCYPINSMFGFGGYYGAIPALPGRFLPDANCARLVLLIEAGGFLRIGTPPEIGRW